MENIQLIFGSDHAGYEMKEKLINFILFHHVVLLYQVLRMLVVSVMKE